MRIFSTALTAAAVFTVLIFFNACGKQEKSPDAEKNNKQSETNNQKSGDEKKDEKNPQNASDNNDGIKKLTYDVGKLPESIKYDGKLVTAAKWIDNNGENYVFVTETAEKKQKGDERMKELFGYQYVVSGGEAKQLWKINDFIKDCPLDITLQYMPKSLSVTDLNKDGIAETTFLYRMSCKGDVSEDDMKLMMHEGDTKYAIRGSMKLEMAGESYGGQMNVDPAFDKAPKEFLAYAKEQWNKYRTEKIGN